MSGNQQPSDLSDFGLAFTQLLRVAGLTPDRVLERLGRSRRLVSRSTLYDWKRGEHLPEDTGPMVEVVRVCLDAARNRGVSLDIAISDERRWLKLLADTKQARDTRIALSQSNVTMRADPTPQGRLIGSWDPVRLGVHRAIGDRSLPEYVRRSHDDLLCAVLDPATTTNRLVVVRGGSSTGKSRAAYEAVKLRLATWRVDYPRTPNALAQRLRTGIGRRTVLWLGELRHYIDADGGTEALSLLADMMEDNGQVLVITTLWPEHWAAYTSYRYEKPGTTDPAAIVRSLLTPLPELAIEIPEFDPSNGAVIDIPDRFTEEEMKYARQLGDAALRQAIAAALRSQADGKVAQYLAAAPDLLNHYSGPGADPYGQAVIMAAIDAARLGHRGPYTSSLLKDALTGYLTDQQRAVDRPGWWDASLSYATKKLKGAVRALEPTPPNDGTGIIGYKLTDYLEQHDRRARKDLLYPATLWDSLAACTTGSSDLARLGQSAVLRGLYRYAAIFWFQAIAANETLAAEPLLKLLRKIDKSSAHEVCQWVAEHADIHDAWRVSTLLHALRKANAKAALTTLLSRHPADQVDLDYAWKVALMVDELHYAGADEAVTTLAERAARGTALDRPWHIPRLLRSLCQAGAKDAVAALTNRAAEHISLDDLWAVARLLHDLRGAKAETAVAALARRAADQTALDDPWGVARLLDAIREVGVEDAATVLAGRVARHSDCMEFSEFLHTLRRARAFMITHALEDGHPPVDLLQAIPRGRTDRAITVLVAWVANYWATDTHPLRAGSILRELRALTNEGVLGAFVAHVVDQTTFSARDKVIDILDAINGSGVTNALLPLAVRAVGHDAFDKLESVTRLLDAPLMLESKEAMAGLASRAASQAALNNPGGVAWLLEALSAAGAKEAVAELASRAASQAAVGRSEGVVRLLDALRVAGATEAATLLTKRACDAGLFAIYLRENPAGAKQFRFGREPDGQPSQPWQWQEVVP